MSKQTEALKLALEALEGLEALLLSMGLTHLIVYGDAEKAITNLQKELEDQPAQQTIHCKHRRENNGVCPHHNLQCGWPKCNEPEQPAQQQEPVAYMVKAHGMLQRLSRRADVADELACKYREDDPNAEVLPLYTSPPAQPQQEPVAWATRMGEYAHIHWGAKRPEYPMVYEVPLYTSPPASKPWVGLTEEQIAEIAATPCAVAGSYVHTFARAIEAKLREKNT